MTRNVWHWTTLILLLLVATWLRVYRLVELPPGLHYDEAANGILASEIAFEGFRPIFITSYTGKEVLYFYLAGSLMRLIGDSVFALRLASAFTGLLTISASYWLATETARALAPQAKIPYLRLAGLMTAILLATHFPHLIFSRLGFRAITQPLLQALTVATLLYALRKSSYRAFALSGLWLGLAAYSYLAVRLFPIVIFLIALPLLRRHWRGLLLALGTATLTLLPFANFLIRNPETFWVRISQVSDQQPIMADYTSSFVQSFSILLGLAGDPYWRFNNPDQPLLPLPLALLFVAGLVWIAWKWGRNRRPQSQSVVVLLWVTPFIMILPTALALGEIVPSNLRAIGLYPFVLLPIALLLADSITRIKQSQLVSFAPLALFGLLVVTGYTNYFVQWGTRTDTFYDSDSDLIGAANYIDNSDVPTYIAALHYRHPTVAFASERYDGLKWLVNSEAIVVPPYAAQVVYPHNSPPPAWVQTWLGAPLSAEIGIDGATLYTAYQLPATPPQPSITTDVNFSDIVRLVGYDSAETGTPTPTIRLYWEVLNTPDRNFAPFVHLTDHTDFRWAQRETIAYPSEQWEVGETIIQDVTFELPAGMPLAEFNAVIGLFDGNDRLPIVDADGRFAGTTFQIEDLLLAGNPNKPRGAEILDLDSSNGQTWMLGGFKLAVDSAETGTKLPLTLTWSLSDSLPYTLLLVDSAGNPTPIYENIVQLGQTPYRYATDRTFPHLPTDLPAGSYTIQLVADGQTIDLKSIELIETDRQFDAPAVDNSSNILFDNQLRLIGYELSETQLLTLVWQAETTPQNDYTIFIHALHPDGTCCVWQQDTQPQQGAYPTTRWIKDEIIIDQYQLAIDDADLSQFPIEIGLYLAETGQRLSIGSQDYWILDPHPSPVSP